MTASRTYSIIDKLSANRFAHWQSTGTGAGLSVNPNFPQYSAFADDVSQIGWNLLSPTLLGVGGGGTQLSVGGYSALKAFLRQPRFSGRYFRFTGRSSNLFGYTDNLYSIRTYNNAPSGGLFSLSNQRGYRTGQFAPLPQRVRSYDRRYQPFSPLGVSPLSNGLRPSPIFYPNLHPLVRRSIQIGGPTLLLNRELQRRK